MPAKSKKQQRYFGMIEAGILPKPKGMTKDEVHKMASTKRKGLPNKVAKKVSRYA